MSTSKSAGALAARVEAAQNEMRALKNRINTSSLLTFLIGLATLAALSFYFWYGHREITDLTDPDKITRMGQTMLDDHIPAMRQQAEDEIVNRAPELVQQLSEQAVANMPMARERLVEYTSGQIQHALEQTELVSADRFRQLIRDHRDMLERDAQDLESSPELSADRFNQLVDMIDTDLGIELKDKSEVARGMLVALNENLDRLAPGQDLTPQEAQTREVLMIFRRLQQTKRLGGAEPVIGADATIRSSNPPAKSDADAPKLEDVAVPANAGDAPADGRTPKELKAEDAPKPVDAKPASDAKPDTDSAKGADAEK